MKPNDARLILLPGLRADARMFTAQRQAFPQLEVPAWLTPEEHESLADYGARMAQQLNPKPPFFLGGVSFGGMVAREMARRLQPVGLIQIASCPSGKNILRSARLLERIGRLFPTTGDAPPWLLRPVLSFAFGRLTPEVKRLLWKMLREAEEHFSHWAYRAIIDWPGGGEITCPQFHLHGACDRVIPARNVRPDQLVPGAGHLLNMTHAEVVNDLLLKWMGGVLENRQLPADRRTPMGRRPRPR